MRETFLLWKRFEGCAPTDSEGLSYAKKYEKLSMNLKSKRTKGGPVSFAKICKILVLNGKAQKVEWLPFQSHSLYDHDN